MEDYEVTKDGKVFSLKFGKRKELKLNTDKKGYHYVRPSSGGIKKHWFVHRLVATEHIPNPLNLPEINHKDGNKLNNNDWNLEWSTGFDNMQHGYKNGLINNTGNLNGRAILSEKQVYEIRSKYVPRKYTIPRLSLEYGVCCGTIQAIILRRIWKHLS